MTCDPFLLSVRPEEDPEGGNFSEESSGRGDDNSVLGGDSTVTGPLSAVLLVMCLVGMAGNIYTLVVASGGVTGRSAGSLGVYVLNLALADFLYLSTIPFVVCTYFAHDWFFGDVGCRLLLSLDLLTMHASIFLLTAMSLERYWAVTRPLQARRAGNTYRKLASAILWLLSLLLTAPMMAMIQLRDQGDHHKRICFPTWTPDAFRLYLTVLFATSILVPGLVLGVVYARLAQAYRSSTLGLGPLAHARVLLFSRIFGIIAACWACFLPFWAWQLTRLYCDEGLGLGPTAQAYLNFGVTCLAYGNSCVNPFLYTLLTRSYRQAPGHSGRRLLGPWAPSRGTTQGTAGDNGVSLVCKELSASTGEHGQAEINAPDRGFSKLFTGVESSRKGK
ncbi:PREDICTED: urotensin-2 receptor-like [Tinamus guttatus]|uniref:urotensin-2 receptor-like n=1 Tax=Tinamus guttatus TaxID=94827 RepID=UPI00052E86F8|nr:PREDICTED: urotensin-2 receptor-like [Tinamus guttatus]